MTPQTPSLRFRPPSSSNEVVVVGGGIVGASVTYWLARSGVRVTCCEGQYPATGATGASFSMDITSRKTPQSFYDLSVLGAKEHESLANELGRSLWRHETVVLEWGREPADRRVVRRRVERLRAWGQEAEFITRGQAKRYVPSIIFDSGDDECLALYPAQAWYDAVVLTHLLLGRAAGMGATILVGSDVASVERRSDQITGVTTTQGDSLATDVLIDCAGARASYIAELAGGKLPLQQVPGVVAQTRATGLQLDAIVMAPRINVRPTSDGGVKLHSYAADAHVQDHGHPAESLGAAVGVLRSEASALLPPLRGQQLSDIRTGVRPIPPDGLPAIGFLPPVDGLYIVVTHSAAHLGPLIGRLVAEEVMDHRSSALEPFRPERLLNPANTAAVADESTAETQIRLANHGVRV